MMVGGEGVPVVVRAPQADPLATERAESVLMTARQHIVAWLSEHSTITDSLLDASAKAQDISVGADEAMRAAAALRRATGQAIDPNNPFS